MDRIEKLGFTPDYQTPEELAATVKRDFEKIKAVAKQAGIAEQ